MKILISALQVAEGASKGHLHPALEIGFALKQRGHHVAILPLPSAFNQDDKKEVENCGLEIIEPPCLPNSVLLSPEKLSKLAANQAKTADAYHSFLIAPLEYQFENVVKKIKAFNPNIVVYDLLVYAAPLAAGLLQIPDVGYCAGLKLIADPALTHSYQSVYKTLAPEINQFLQKYALKAAFHNLELLSSSCQFVFTFDHFFQEKQFSPAHTVCVGPLPNKAKYVQPHIDIFKKIKSKTIILCFGSVLDPYDYPVITKIIVKLAQQFKFHLLIRSRESDFFPQSDQITVSRYLPMSHLLKTASLLIHHGGANTFSEAFHAGIPQILIPLTNDQPIQAALLQHLQAGIAIYPNEVTEARLQRAFEILLDSSHPIHDKIQAIKSLFQSKNGAYTASMLIEKIAKV